jgi:hypothetical protein
VAACAKLNIPCRNVPKDDPCAVEITSEDWDRLFALSPLADSPLQSLSEQSLSEEATMETHSTESVDTPPPLEEAPATETKVRYYRFGGANDAVLPPKDQEILLAAESQIADMADEDEHDMEKALHALAEQTQAAFVSQSPYDDAPTQKEPEEPLPSVLDSEPLAAKKPNDRFPTQSRSPDKPKDFSMTQDENQTVTHAAKNKVQDNKTFGDLSSWEQVLEDRESTLAAREKVLRLRQKDVQDMEDRLHEERKTFNADYEEKKAFLEDKEQRLKKIFERIEEVAYEFRRNTRSEGDAD